MNLSPAATTINIDGRTIGPGHPCYVIAEMSANHGQDYQRAVEIVRAAAWAGADAVKLQTYTPDTLTVDCPDERFLIRGSAWDGQRFYDLYAQAQMPWEWQPRLAAVAAELGMGLFSTAYDPTAVDYLESIAAPAYKVASFELVDLPLLRRVAATGKPVVLSTGMASLAEIAEAASALRGAGCRQLALLKCTSAYPAAPDEMYLRGLPRLAETFGVPVGLSDHSLELAVPVTAVALGASIIEKHLTLSRADGGPDSGFSLEPEEFRAMVHAVRTAERALGNAEFGPGRQESRCLRGRRSLFVVRDVRAGQALTSEDVRSIRPGDGLHPRHLDQVVGRRAARDIRRGTPVSWELIDPA
jgi:pseudaminic acid synthase